MLVKATSCFRQWPPPARSADRLRLQGHRPEAVGSWSAHSLHRHLRRFPARVTYGTCAMAATRPLAGGSSQDKLTGFMEMAGTDRPQGDRREKTERAPQDVFVGMWPTGSAGNRYPPHSDKARQSQDQHRMTANAPKRNGASGRSCTLRLRGCLRAVGRPASSRLLALPPVTLICRMDYDILRKMDGFREILCEILCGTKLARDAWDRTTGDNRL